MPKTPNRSENSFKGYEFLIFHVSFLYGQLPNLYGDLYGKTNDAKCHHWTQGTHRFFFIQIKKYIENLICENVENCSAVLYRRRRFSHLRVVQILVHDSFTYSFVTFSKHATDTSSYCRYVVVAVFYSCTTPNRKIR